jgi:hypothetical protein
MRLPRFTRGVRFRRFRLRVIFMIHRVGGFLLIKDCYIKTKKMGDMVAPVQNYQCTAEFENDGYYLLGGGAKYIMYGLFSR